MKCINFFIVFFLVGLVFPAMGQINSDMKMDTIYFLDGRSKLAMNLLQGTENVEDFRYIVSDDLNSTPELGRIEKSEVYYLYTGGKYQLINEKTPATEQKRLRDNLMSYNKQRKGGWAMIGIGVGLLAGSQIFAELQVKKFTDGNIDAVNEVPKIMSYSGYGFMLIGTVIHLNAGRFIKRGTVDITPAGVRLGIGIN